MTGVTPTDDEGREPALLERVGATGASAISLDVGPQGLKRGLWFGLVALILGCVAIAVASQFSSLPSFDWRFAPGWLVLSIAAFVALQWSHTELWVLMVASLGSHIDRRRGQAIWSTTLLARYVPTSMLMAVARTALAEREGVPKRISLASVVYEVALNMFAALAIGVYFVVELPTVREEPVRWVALGLPAVALVALHPRVFHPIADSVLRRLGREPLPLSLSLRQVLLYSLAYAGGLVVGGVGVYACARAIHPVASDDLALVVASYSIGYAGAVLAFVVPGGLGAREAGLAAALSPAMPTPVAIAVAVAVRLIQILIELLLAVVTSLRARRAGAAAGEDRPRSPAEPSPSSRWCP